MSSEEHQGNVKVVINGEVHEVPRVVTFEQIVKLAFPNLVDSDTIAWDVEWVKGPGGRGESGELTPRSDPLTVERGMVFHVSYTDKS